LSVSFRIDSLKKWTTILKCLSKIPSWWDSGAGLPARPAGILTPVRPAAGSAQTGDSAGHFPAIVPQFGAFPRGFEHFQSGVWHYLKMSENKNLMTLRH
jgi:hypothetical protein